MFRGKTKRVIVVRTVSSSKIIEFNNPLMSVGLKRDSSYLWLEYAETHEPAESYSSSIRHDTFPRRKLFTHFNIAQHLPLPRFCCFEFVYSSSSQSADSNLRCLNLFPITLIPQHRRMKETLNEKQSFHLGHDSITRAALPNVFFPRAFRAASSGLKRRMY